MDGDIPTYNFPDIPSERVLTFHLGLFESDTLACLLPLTPSYIH